MGEMDKFLETYNLPKLNLEEEESLNRPTIACEIEAVIKKSRHTKTLHWTVSQGNFTKKIKEVLTPILLKLF